MVDLGTGSGVLAIAASQLGASSVVAVDRDADALATARDHIMLNVASGVACRQCDIRDADDMACASIVLANLTGAVVCDGATTLLQCVTPGGVLVVSGVTEPEEAAVRSAFESDATVVGRAVEEEWVALTLRQSTTDGRRSTLD